MSLGSESNFFFGAAGAGAGGYEIERSLRFNNDDSAYLNRTPSSAGNRKTWTWAAWFKPSNIGGTGSTGGHSLFSVRTGSGDSGLTDFIYNTDGTLLLTGAATTFKITTAKFRDFSAWYHIALQLDTTQATAADRIKIYVNGSRIAEFSTDNNPAQNADLAINNATLHKIGGYSNVYLDGYLADVHFIDGQALDPTSFGKFDDNGVWQPITYAGTYGTNGFHLDFSDNSTAAALGTDSSGNGNDWTVNNITGAGTGTAYRTLELSVNHPSGVVSQPGNAFDATRIATYVNTSTWAITNTAWLGSYANGYAEARWIPVGGYEVSSSLRVYFGVYSNTAASSTLTVTYTDSSTESSSQFTSGTNNWMTLFTASNAAGKTIQKVEISNPSATNVQFGGFVVDDQIVTSLNTDTDSFIDSPTNGTQTDTGAGGEVRGNYATWNQLIVTTNNTLSQGNLQASHASSTGWSGNSQQSNSSMFVGNMGMSSGKWYWEIAIDSATDSSIGIVNRPGGHNNYVGYPVNGIAEAWGWAAGGTIYHTSGITNDGGTLNTYAVNGTSILGFALDMDNGRLYVSNNGTYENSGDPAAGTGYCASGMSGTYYFAASQLGSNSTWTGTVNTGQRLFAYSAPTGFKALCTANLPDPTIADGSTAFDAVTYTGNSSTNVITGLGFSPDFLWIKARDIGTYDSRLFDSVRGVDKPLYSSLTSAEATGATNLTSFDSNGFTLGSPAQTNLDTSPFIAWAWDAGTSTESNTDGSITSSVRANPSAGFSIVSYTGTGANATVGHGLNAAPEFAIFKVRSTTNNWGVYHKSLGATDQIKLNQTSASSSSASFFQDTEPTSSVIYLGADSTANYGSQTMIAYCFAPIEGYSAFGTYTGNGSSEGPFVYTAYGPRWIMIKASSDAGSWVMYDTERDPDNTGENWLYANTAAAEVPAATYAIQVTSNGFKLRGTSTENNGTGRTYIYAAFAENPFKISRAR